MENSFVAFLDESRALRPFDTKVYMVCAALVEVERINDVRVGLEPLRLPGQKKLHWTDESISRKLDIAKAIADLDNMNAIVSHYGEASGKEERFRRKCLEQIYYELDQMGINRVVMESRSKHQDAKDRGHIVALQGRGLFQNMRIEHKRGGDEPLLWIPDAVLGALNLREKGHAECWEFLAESMVVLTKTSDSN